MLTRLAVAGPVLYLLVGMASAIAGLVPWLITGMRLPVQNLWASTVFPGQMPITLLPFSQYALSLIVALIVVGSAIAGVAARASRASRASRAQHPRFAVVSLAVSVAAVQVAALVQTTLTVMHGVKDTSASRLYLTALVIGTAASIAVGLVLLVLIARAPAAGVVVALSFAAIALQSWLNALVLPFGVVSTEPNLGLLAAIRWVPALVVGLAVVWAGIRSIGRAIAAILGLVVLWIAPAAVTAVTSAAGSRVLAAHPLEMLDYGSQVFVSALGVAGDTLSLLVPAIVVMVLGLGARGAMRRWGVEHAPAS
ncbi:MAG: hypothetical protein H7279_03950 [Microbacteriaceae bacterium]|nr:hypothetical protein [Microbacteriaceae bacterium]